MEIWLNVTLSVVVITIAMYIFDNPAREVLGDKFEHYAMIGGLLTLFSVASSILYVILKFIWGVGS